MTNGSTLSEHPIHPWYGPCDGLEDGENCSECVRVVKEQKLFLSHIYANLTPKQRDRIANLWEKKNDKR